VERLRGRVVLKFSMFALVGVVGLLPTEASAQFPIPIPLPFPHIDLGRRPPVSHSVPSHHSGAPESREENNRGTTEKDATQDQNSIPSTAPHQQQEQASTPGRPSDPIPDSSSPRKNNADNPPVFLPSR
jgi:hypothetical protein